jgi:dinuclear metal center YbgI/SA1388 family protein
MLTVADVVGFMEQFAPTSLAADWDNVGLLLGDQAREVARVMTCLTVTPESADEAVASQAQLIVTHHPIFFHPVKRLTTGTPEGRMLLALVQAGVAVYCPHTAFDNTVGGINELLAGCLDLRDVRSLRRKNGTRQCKVVVFVPEGDLARVSSALFDAGAGNIGQYSECSFRLLGTGTFFGSEATQPAVGQKGRREEVSEWRLEAICPEDKVERVIAGIRQAHSYEEPAYDVYPLHTTPSALGEGRLGKLPRPLRLGELAQAVKTHLRVGQLQIVGDPERLVERVAIVCGAGGDFLPDALQAGADVLLTGELRFHDYLKARSGGLGLVVAGHYATERLAVEELAVRLQRQWPGLEVWASRREQDPVLWM